MFNLTSGECPLTECCYWTPVIGQLDKPITTRVPGFLTNQLIVTIVVSSLITVVMVPTVMASRAVIALTTRMYKGEEWSQKRANRQKLAAK